MMDCCQDKAKLNSLTNAIKYLKLSDSNLRENDNKKGKMRKWLK